MSDGYHKLDELFRNKFENVELPVSDKLLADIKKDLNIPGKRKRRFGFWIWLLAVLGFMVTTTGVFHYFFSREKDGYNNSTVVKENDSKTIKIPSNLADTGGSIEGIVSKKFKKIAENTDTVGVMKNKAEESIPAKQLKNNEPPQTKNAPVKHIGFTAKEEESVVNNNERKVITTHDTSVKQKQEKTGFATQLAEKNKKEKISASKLADERALPDKYSGTNVQTLSEKNELASNPQPEKAKTTITEKIIVSEANKKAPSASDNTLQSIVDTITSKNDTTIVMNSEKSVDTAKQNNADKQPITENEASEKFNFFAEINGGPSQSFRILNPENNILVSRRDSNEKSFFTYNGGFDFGAVINDKYQISLGLGIDTKGEKFHYQGQEGIFYTWYDTTIIYDTIIDSVVYIDTTVILVPQTEQQQAAVAEKSGQNKYQYFKLPFMFGYRFNIKEKWFFTPNVGVVLNYLITAQSTWFDPEKQQYITNSARNVYSPIIIAARAKIDIGLKLNDKWSLLIQPGYTRFLQSIYRKEERFKQYPYSYDINIAVRYRF